MSIKKYIIIAITLLAITGIALFSMGTLNNSETESVAEQTTNQELPETVMYSELRNRPDIIFKAYKDAYPETIQEVYEANGEWVMKMNDGTLFYWAQGRFLTEEKKDNWEEYRAYRLYPNFGEARDPSEYTAEDIERLRDYTSASRRGAPQLPQDVDLMRYLIGVGDRAQTEASLVTELLFGQTIRVNKVAALHLDSITEQVTELAKTNSEVSEFLETLGDVSSYNWRVIAGTDRLSNHSYGIAIDILPRNSGSKMIYWAWVRDINDDWMLIPQEDLWSPPKEVIDIFYNHGFTWGGTWPMYDNMHFEYRPETVELAKYVTNDL